MVVELVLVVLLLAQADEDIKVLVEGVKIALAMAQTQAFQVGQQPTTTYLGLKFHISTTFLAQRLGTKFWDRIPMPGCEGTELWSDEYWACMCRYRLGITCFGS